MPVSVFYSLFCLQNAALVQFEAHVQAQGAITNLNGAVVFDQSLQVQYSKHATIADGRGGRDVRWVLRWPRRFSGCV